MKKHLREVAHEIANDLYEAEVIDAVMLREYDALSIPPVRKLRQREINRKTIVDKRQRAC